MNNYDKIVENYLDFCSSQKKLNEKTVRAYLTDLQQFGNCLSSMKLTELSTAELEDYIKNLHRHYKPKSVKRKIASIKAFFCYLENHDIITSNPWTHVQSKFREPATLPRIIPLDTIEIILTLIYKQIENGKTNYRRRNAIRDAAICELLFATGLRIFELCNLIPLEECQYFFNGTVTLLICLHELPALHLFLFLYQPVKVLKGGIISHLCLYQNRLCLLYPVLYSALLSSCHLKPPYHQVPIRSFLPVPLCFRHPYQMP